MKKATYISSSGDDKNDGLSEQSPVYSGERAVRISLDHKTEEFRFMDEAARVRVNEELERKRRR